MTCLAESCFAERKGTLFTSSAKKLIIIQPMFNGCRSQQQPRPFLVAEQWHKQTLAYLSYLLFDSALLFKGHLSTTEWTRIWKTTLSQHIVVLCWWSFINHYHPFTDTQSLFNISNTSWSPRETCRRSLSWQGWLLSRLELPLSPWLTSPLWWLFTRFNIFPFLALH